MISDIEKGRVRGEFELNKLLTGYMYNKYVLKARIRYQYVEIGKIVIRGFASDLLKTT